MLTQCMRVHSSIRSLTERVIASSGRSAKRPHVKYYVITRGKPDNRGKTKIAKIYG